VGGTTVELRVRRASADDAAGIAAVLNRIIEGGRHSLLDTPFSEAEERGFIASLPALAFLHAAETRGGEIAGFQTVEPWNSFATHEFDHVATMGTYVAEEFRRRGVGRALAAASFAAARAAGYEKILTDLRADNLESLCYHLSLGFNVVGTARRHARLRGRDIDVVLVEAFL
jgi:L-amino acid N-acyltransferase YncA